MIYTIHTWFFFLQVTMATVTRLCVTKSVPTVNGQFPGPRLVVREGDRLVVQVHNNINSNVTFHWYIYCCCIWIICI